MSKAHWRLTVDGCPKSFSTPGCPATTFPADEDYSSTTLLTDTLVRPSGTIDFSLNPVTGDLQTGPLTFLLEDADDGAGHPLATYLGTRPRSELQCTTLAATMSATTLTFTVADGASLPTLPAVLWIGQEAILCASRATNVVTVDASGRGYYGSRAREHRVDADRSMYPGVYTAMPSFAKRRVVLWRVDGTTGLAAAFWRGRVQSGPMKGRAANARFALECESVWSWNRGLVMGAPDAACALRGYSMRGISLAVGDSSWSAGSGGAGFIPRAGWTLGDPLRAVYNSAREAIDAAVENVRSQITEAVPTASLTMVASCDAGTATLYASGSTLPGTGQLHVIFGLWGATSRGGGFAGSAESSDPRTVTVTVDGYAETLVFGEQATSSDSGQGAAVPVTRVDTLPTDWSAEENTQAAASGGHRAVAYPILRGEYDQDTWLVLRPASDRGAVVIANDDNLSGPAVNVHWALTPRAGGWEDGSLVRYPVTKPVQLRLGVEIECTHWAYGLQLAIEDQTYLRSEVDPRDWSWLTVDRVVGATPAYSARDWTLDGTQKLGDLLSATLPLHGAAVGLRSSGRIGLGVIGPPTSTSHVVASISAADELVSVEPASGPVDAQIVNVARVKVTGFTLTTVDAVSVDSFGQGGVSDLRLDGLPGAAELASHPIDLALVVSRHTRLWGQERQVIDIALPWQSVLNVFMFDYVTVTDFRIPWRGAVGIEGEYAQVIGWRYTFADDAVSLKAMLWDLSAGYSRAVRVDTLFTDDGSGHGWMTVATAYIGPSDYAGSDRSDYAGPPNDGGASGFEAGDRVRLERRDTETVYELDLVIYSVSGTTILFTTTVSTSPVDWPALVAGGAIVDMVLRDYTNSSASAKMEAWCADRTDRSIDAVANAAQEWAP